MKTLEDFTWRGKKVLVRVGFNVPIENEDTKQIFRIAAARETVEYLLERGARVALLSHLGRPRDREESLSLGQLADDVALILDRPVVFVDACFGSEVERALSGAAETAVVLLENVRFDRRETAADKKERSALARQLAAPFDVFVNDAFSVSHRRHASVVELAEILPAAAGKRLEREVEVLSRLVEKPAHPAVAVVGGAKIATKLPLIENLEKTYDRILLGGKVANEALAEGRRFSPKVSLPTDFLADGMDIGPRTVSEYRRAILAAATVIWNGPVGKYEEEIFAGGTEAIVRALAETKAFTLVGGGESVEALERWQVTEKIDFVSTGGGAMLDFLSGVPLPGLEVLKKR